MKCNHCRGNCACPPTLAEHLDVNERRGCAGGTCTCPPETTPCETCDSPTRLANATRCDGCWEVESRLHSYLHNGGAKAVTFVEQTLRTVRRATLSAREAKALTVVCPAPRCGATAGEPCRRSSGAVSYSAHIVRLEAAERKP